MNSTSPSYSRRWVVVFGAYLAVLLTIFILAYLRLIPTQLASIPLYDTVGHFILLGLAGLLAHRALNRRSFKLLGLGIPWGIFLVGVFAVLEENLQRFTAYRTYALSDLAANLCGILLFYCLDRLVQRIREGAGRSGTES
jgi:hypothetical protein